VIRLLPLLLSGTLSASVADDLQRLEGFSSTSYTDTTGHLSVGFGHKIAKSVSMSRETALAVLADDIAIAERGARRVFPSFDSHPQRVQDVLVEMAFQLGSTGCAKFIKFGRAIAAHDYATASREMLSSKWAKQCPSRVKELAQRIAKCDD
jgi:lysozyme